MLLGTSLNMVDYLVEVAEKAKILSYETITSDIQRPKEKGLSRNTSTATI
jgi:hypothetical protein